MTLRKPLLILSALFMLTMAGTVFGQPSGGYHYILRPMDQYQTMAGMPLDIPIFMENSDTNTVLVTCMITQDPTGLFSLDSTSEYKQLHPGQFDVAVVHFMAAATGTYQALFTVTDGIVTDSLVLTVEVTPGPGPFVLLPPFQEITADLNVPTSIPVIIQNLTQAPLTVQLSFNGANEFTYAGNSSLTIPALGSETVLLSFLSSVDGRFSTVMTVTDGSYTDSVWIGAVAYDRPYTWIVPFMNEIETMAGYQSALPVMLQNSSSSTVTLQLALTGSNVFTLDPASQQVELYPGMGIDAKISVYSLTPGTYTALLTVTDGSLTDSLELKAVVNPGAGNFILMPEFQETRALANESVTLDYVLQSLSTSSQSISVTVTGDSRFSVISGTPFTLDPQGSARIAVQFSGAPNGVYTAQIAVSDGVETDSALAIVYVGPGQGGPLFTLQFDGKENFMLFETPANTTLTKDITITNISGSALPLNLVLSSDSSFSIPVTTMTIDSGASATLPVTFANYFGGFGDGMLLIEGGIQAEPVFLMGMTPPYTDHNGVLVTNAIDFGMVDSNTTICLDALIENRTSNTVTITGATLSGFSTSYILQQPFPFPMSLQPGEMLGIPVCFRPVSVNQVENEVLTIAFTNPAANPAQQTATVDLTGRSTTGIRFPGDSCGLVGWYVNTISAPIGGQSDATIELFNITSMPITLDKATWEAGNDLGIYSLQTTLPVTIQPHNPAVSNSGKTDITIRYAPTAQSSTVGVEDLATLRLEGSNAGQPALMYLTLLGIPVNPAPNGGTIAMFPKNNRVPSIEMGAVDDGSTRILEFSNNLQVPVTVRGFQLSSNERFEITNAMDYPKTLQPGETAALMLRSNGVPPTRSTDVLTMESSHEHLNSRFDLISGQSLTGVDDVPAARAVTATISPNPSSDRISVTLSAPLAQGSVQVLDLLGRVVAEHHGAMRNWTWDGMTGGVAAMAGAYHIHISGVTEDGVRVSLVKNALLVR